MAITINGKTYRNLQQQVLQNMNDIADLKEHGTGESYSAGTGINISDENVISIDNTVETKANATNRFVSKDNLTDYSINEIIVGNSQVDSDNVDLRAVYSQDVKSEVSLEPTSTIIRTMSGTDTSTIGLSATEIDITTPMLKYGTNEVATKNEIPTDTSDLTNNAGFITIADVPVPTAGTGINITNGQISVDNTVAMKTDIYTKTEIDNKDTATLNAAKAYTDAQVIAGASVYEYELVFDESDNEDTWSYRFISTDGGLINTSVPETYAELVQFVQDYGLHAANLYKLVGYVVNNGHTYYSTLYYSTTNSTLKVTSPSRTDQTIDASNLITNSIKLYKRTC